MRSKSFHQLRLMVAAGLLSMFYGGCATSQKDVIVPFTQDQAQAFFARARPPQVFGVTVYASDIGPVFTGAFRLHPESLAQLPFRGNAPIIELKPGGPGEFLALIDTSSRDNWLSVSGADRANIIALAGPQPFVVQAEHVKDDNRGFLCAVPTVRFGTSTMETGLMYVQSAFGPLGPLSRGQTSPRPDAVVGFSMLRAFSFVQFDFEHRMMTFASTSKYKPEEAKLIATLPMSEAGGVLTAEGNVDGKPATIILDTGGDYEFSMKDPPGTTIRQVSLGDLVFRQVVAQSSEELGLGLLNHPRIGRKLLARFRMTLDFSQRQIHFERP